MQPFVFRRQNNLKTTRHTFKRLKILEVAVKVELQTEILAEQAHFQLGLSWAVHNHEASVPQNSSCSPILSPNLELTLSTSEFPASTSAFYKPVCRKKW